VLRHAVPGLRLGFFLGNQLGAERLLLGVGMGSRIIIDPE
jgi:hypothetical protein